MPRKNNSRFAVIGTGRYGTQIARKLAERGAEVYAIDRNKESVDILDEAVYTAVALDSTDKRALESQNLQEVDAAVIAIGENFEAVIITAMNLLDLKVPRVIARASNPEQRLILEKIGITEILFPEEEVGAIVTERLLNPNVLSLLELSESYEIVEILAPKGVIDQRVGDIGFKSVFNITLITIKQEFEIDLEEGKKKKQSNIIGVVSNDTLIKEDDHLVLFGTLVDIERFTEIRGED